MGLCFTVMSLNRRLLQDWRSGKGCAAVPIWIPFYWVPSNCLGSEGSSTNPSHDSMLTTRNKPFTSSESFSWGYQLVTRSYSPGIPCKDCLPLKGLRLTQCFLLTNHCSTQIVGPSQLLEFRTSRWANLSL
jgi:hypothetical protein